MPDQKDVRIRFSSSLMSRSLGYSVSQHLGKIYQFSFLFLNICYLIKIILLFSYLHIWSMIFLQRCFSPGISGCLSLFSPLNNVSLFYLYVLCSLLLAISTCLIYMHPLCLPEINWNFPFIDDHLLIFADYSFLNFLYLLPVGGVLKEWEVNMCVLDLLSLTWTYSFSFQVPILHFLCEIYKGVLLHQIFEISLI